MENIPQSKAIYNRQLKQPSGKRQRRRRPQTLSAIITTSKAEQGFMVAVSLNCGRTCIVSDLLHIKDCPSPERAFLAGYNLAQVLAEAFPPNTRLYIGNVPHKVKCARTAPAPGADSRIPYFVENRSCTSEGGQTKKQKPVAIDRLLNSGCKSFRTP